ncbi:hypothetical protein SLE2022_093840 [Rubroshorea leprosula]
MSSTLIELVANPSDPSKHPEETSTKIRTPEAQAHVRSLHECIAYQRALDLDLDNLLLQRADLDKHLLHLQQFVEVLDIVKANSNHMSSNVHSTCDLADQVSRKL